MGQTIGHSWNAMTLLFSPPYLNFPNTIFPTSPTYVCVRAIFKAKFVKLDVLLINTYDMIYF
jgi:hypothetical protein